MSAALVLDIDGTLDTADPDQVERLVNHTRKHGVESYINTARSQAYCRHPDPLTTSIAGPKSHGRHHCLVHPDPPTSKVTNMEKIRKKAGVDDPRCVLLIDDRPENIDAVEDAGFSGILVNERTGIRRKTVDKAQRLLRRCLADKRSRGIAGEGAKHGGGFLWRLVARVVIVVGILFLLALLLF